MTQISSRISTLRQLATPAASAVVADMLGQALQYARPDEATELARSLIEADEIIGLVALIKHLDRIPESSRRHLNVSGERLARLTDHARTGKSRRHLLELSRIAGTEAALALPGMVPWLKSQDRDLAAATADFFLECTRSALGPIGRARPNVLIADPIDRALAETLRSGAEHRQTAAMLAVALACARPGPALRTALDEDDEPGMLALRRVPSRTRWPDVCRNLLVWTDCVPLAHVVMRHLHTLQTVEQWNELLHEGVLLHAPARRRALRQLHHPGRALPDVALATELNPRSQRYLPDYIASLGVRTSTRLTYLRDGIALPDPVARLKCILHLRRFRGEEAERARRRYERDAHPVVARTARQAGTMRLAPSEPLPGRSDLETFFEQLPDLSILKRQWRARMLMQEDGDSFRSGCAARLQRGPRSERIMILHLLHRLGQIDELCEAIVPLIHGPDAHVAAAAVTVLADADREEAVEGLRTALRHHDRRVRANAVEAVEKRRDPAMLPLIIPLIDARDNRVRANAIRAARQIVPDRSAQAETRMRRDQDPLHRISGIWLSRFCPTDANELIRVRDELHQLAANDPQPVVRTRAEAAANFLTRRAQKLGTNGKCPGTAASAPGHVEREVHA
ncbi:MAG: HEAT repeat domain-containing protein [Phycisphaerales bacterium]|nr:MAG: HEAT repeat domain-containing protein [Phycisphaerales bacterium]